MNKETKTLKIDGYTVNLHRGKDEPEEIRQRRMALLVNHLKNISIKPMWKWIKENFSELYDEISNML